MTETTENPRPFKTVIATGSEEGLQVHEDTQENYIMGWDFQPLDDASLKCSGCNSMTIHDGVTVDLENQTQYAEENPVAPRRLYVCTNCGKMTLK
jgi:hypothetical protein